MGLLEGSRMIDSRTKGKRGELEAAALLSAITRKHWYRTAQRCGTDTGDVRCDQLPLHVEVKHYRAGLTYWSKRSRNGLVHLANDLYYCDITKLMNVADQLGDYNVSPKSLLVEGFMRQAERDAADGTIPLVMCRQNHGPWLLVWRYPDDDRLCKLLRECRDCAGGSCAT